MQYVKIITLLKVLSDHLLDVLVEGCDNVVRCEIYRPKHLMYQDIKILKIFYKEKCSFCQ